MRLNKRSKNCCKSCGYSWAPRGHNFSVRCPRCQSTAVTTFDFMLGGAVFFIFKWLLILAAIGWVLKVVGEMQWWAWVLTAVAVVGGLWLRARYRVYRAEKDAAMDEQLRQHEEQSRAAEHTRRLRELTDRFGHEVAERVCRAEIWVGATTDMVVAALGEPEQVDQRVLRTKSVKVLKYGSLGRRSYRLKVKVENELVIGWEGDPVVVPPPVATRAVRADAVMEVRQRVEDKDGG